KKNKRLLKVRLLNFFSAKDYEYSVGWEAWRKAILDGKVRQRNNVGGTVRTNDCKVFLKDISGWQGKGTFQKLAEAMGVSIPYKDTFTKDEKGRMADMIQQRPEDFVRYAMDDANATLEIHEKFVDSFRRIQQECFDFAGDDLETAETIPMTAG